MLKRSMEGGVGLLASIINTMYFYSMEDAYALVESLYIRFIVYKYMCTIMPEKRDNFTYNWSDF